MCLIACEAGGIVGARNKVLWRYCRGAEKSFGGGAAKSERGGEWGGGPCIFRGLAARDYAAKTLFRAPAVQYGQLRRLCASYQALLPATWLQNYLNAVQITNTVENRNIIRYNLRIFTRIFSA